MAMRQVQTISSDCFLWPLWAAHTGKERQRSTRWLTGWKAQAGAGTQGPDHRHTTPAQPSWDTFALFALIHSKQSLHCGPDKVPDTTRSKVPFKMPTILEVRTKSLREHTSVRVATTSLLKSLGRIVSSRTGPRRWKRDLINESTSMIVTTSWSQSSSLATAQGQCHPRSPLLSWQSLYHTSLLKACWAADSKGELGEAPQIHSLLLPLTTATTVEETIVVHLHICLPLSLGSHIEE